MGYDGCHFAYLPAVVNSDKSGKSNSVVGSGRDSEKCRKIVRDFETGNFEHVGST